MRKSWASIFLVAYVYLQTKGKKELLIAGYLEASWNGSKEQFIASKQKSS